ncbi:5-deoxy-glucuronate isomerase [Gordonia sp. PKS22-38]|uniref:5-deoxy-glucuronate isomerase n=1 Tax=Gordonia prachuapensis TaxID=3115651 RepID=A0ABU7MMV2_9ACTN|nr:5-deoxy-glucuronate isomerase [Gordonia sp. PKS22-38]
MKSEYHIPARSAPPPLTVDVTPESAGWTESSLAVVELGPGDSITRFTDLDEIIVVPLAGSATVTCEGTVFGLAGRESVFDGPSDFAYVGCRSEFVVASAAGGRFALCGARARRRLPFRHVPAAEVPVELRGAGHCSRQVHNFGMAGVFEADSLIACEVITPAGNWSSYPAHKHDEHSATESQLEEIYYFEFGAEDRSVPERLPGFGYHRIHGTPERPIEVLEEVRNGDVVLVPHGYHGPSIAAPGHHMYYLNVMAGPGPERAWRISDDPAQSWIRTTWERADVDPRLPLHERSS